MMTEAKQEKKDVLEPLNNASPEIQRIIKRVYKLEKDKLYQQRPHINADIISIIKEEIK
jgi:hypothetical protein